MSSSGSPKRLHSGDSTSERPSKQQKIKEEPKLTGLEGCGILDDVPEKVPDTRKTNKDSERYRRRNELALHAARIRQKRKLASSVSPSWKFMPAKNQQGMPNLTGALCYRNSLLQSLAHLPKIGNWLMKYHKKDMCTHDIDAAGSPCVACAMRKLIFMYWSGNNGALLNALKLIHQTFRQNDWKSGSTSGQADPDEQLTWLVGVLRKQLPEQAFSIFEAVNQLVLNSATHCPACGHKSAIYGEMEGSISVELTPRIKDGGLADYLHKYFRYEVPEYRCDECKEKNNCARTRLLSFSADILLVQLKRMNGFGGKVKDAIPFTSSLDLNKYRTASNKRSSIYQLSAIVSHTGSLSSGHYRCIAKGSDGKWLIFNDSDVSKCSEEEALNPGNGQTGWTPYLLFFQRAPK